MRTLLYMYYSQSQTFKKKKKKPARPLWASSTSYLIIPYATALSHTSTTSFVSYNQDPISWFPCYPGIIIKSFIFHSEKYAGLDKMVYVCPSYKPLSQHPPFSPYTSFTMPRVIFVNLIFRL